MEWFTSIAETYGFGAAVALLGILAVGGAVRELWKENKRIVIAEALMRKEMRDAHEAEMAALREEFATKLEQYAGRLDALHQENSATLLRWKDEAVGTAREVTALAGEIKTSSKSTADALGFLRETIKGDRT